MKLVRALGEHRYNALRLHHALGWIGSHVPRFLRLTASRIMYYWLPPPHEGWPAYSVWIITLASIPAFWIGRTNPASNLLAMVSIVYSCPYAFVQADLRYHYPSLWMTAVPAGYAFTRLAARIRRFAPLAMASQTGDRQEPHRIAPGSRTQAAD